MKDRRYSKMFVMAVGFAVALGGLGIDRAEARSSAQKDRASVTRGSGAQSSSGRAAVTRTGRTSSPRAHSDRRSGHRGDRSYRGQRGHRGHGGFGVSLGYYGGYYGGYYYPYYRGYYYHPYYHAYPVYYSHHPRRYGDFGGLDLNIHPKKTEVWVDGQYLGTAGRFDGFPGHLWLTSGQHELIFVKEGYESVVREVKTLAGVLVDLHIDMEEGDSTPAEALTAFSQEELRRRREAMAADEQASSYSADETRDAGEDTRPDFRTSDVREEPGLLTVKVDPVDASIYLDGRFLGTGGELAKLHSGLMVAPGEHTLEVVRPGFGSEEVNFSIDSGEEASLEVTLSAG